MATYKEGKTVPVTETEIVSEVQSEEHLFNWKIKDFANLQTCPELLGSQQFRFNAGNAIGMPASFVVYLSYKDPIVTCVGYTQEECYDYDYSSQQCWAPESVYPSHQPISSSWISIYIALDETWSTPDTQSFITFQVKIEKKNGSTFKQLGDDRIRTLKGTTGDSIKYGFNNLIDLSGTFASVLVSGCLVIKINVKLFASRPPPGFNLESITNTYKTQFIKNAASDLETIRDDPGVNIVLSSRDGTEFSIGANTLLARSQGFEALIDPIPSDCEKGESKINLDLTSKVLQMVVEYLKTGNLMENWRELDVIEDLTFAAWKYGLIDLLDFFDHGLEHLCNINNAGLLLLIANKFGLRKAEKGILHFIQCFGLESTESYLNILESSKNFKMVTKNENSLQ